MPMTRIDTLYIACNTDGGSVAPPSVLLQPAALTSAHSGKAKRLTQDDHYIWFRVPASLRAAGITHSFAMRNSVTMKGAYSHR